MSYFPPLNLKKRKLNIKIQQRTYQEAVVPTTKCPRYLWILFAISIGSCLVLLLPAGKLRHMRRLKCRKSTSGFRCDGEPFGDIIVKTTCVLWNVNGVPFNLAKRTYGYRAPSSVHILLQDATPTCDVDVYWDSTSEPVADVFTWVAAKDHTEFTLVTDGDTILDQISADLIDHTDAEGWVAYTYPVRGDVKGNGKSMIRIMN